jgi:uncharacterized Zn finger protein
MEDIKVVKVSMFDVHEYTRAHGEAIVSCPNCNLVVQAAVLNTAGKYPVRCYNCGRVFYVKVEA